MCPVCEEASLNIISGKYGRKALSTGLRAASRRRSRLMKAPSAHGADNTQTLERPKKPPLVDTECLAELETKPVLDQHALHQPACVLEVPCGQAISNLTLTLSHGRWVAGS